MLLLCIDIIISVNYFVVFYYPYTVERRDEGSLGPKAPLLSEVGIIGITGEWSSMKVGGGLLLEL